MNRLRTTWTIFKNQGIINRPITTTSQVYLKGLNEVITITTTSQVYLKGLNEVK
jgi:hypothetical protein